MHTPSPVPICLPLITHRAAAEMMGISPRTLARWVRAGDPRAPQPAGRTRKNQRIRFYRMADVAARLAPTPSRDAVAATKLASYTTQLTRQHGGRR